MGYNLSYIGNTVARNKIAPSGARMLEVLFNIRLEEYAKKQDATVEDVVEKTIKEETTAIDYDKLYQIIYAAVYDAVKRVWSE